MGLLDRGDALLARHLPAVAPITVVYARGAERVTITDAVAGRQAFVSNRQNAARVEWADRDYHVPASALTWLQATRDSRAGEPAVGDRITETVNGAECVFEVQTPATGEPAWRYDHAGRAVFRIHTRQVG